MNAFSDTCNLMNFANLDSLNINAIDIATSEIEAITLNKLSSLWRCRPHISDAQLYGLKCPINFSSSIAAI